MPSTAGAALRSAPAYGLGVIGAVLLWCTVATAAAPPDPSVRLYDTVTSAPSRAARISKTAKWIQVREGDLTHRFTGDAVLMNDKLAVVLPQRDTGAEVHRLSAGVYLRRAALWPMPGGPLAACRVVQNDPAAVEVEARFRARRGEALCRFRLTAGDPILQVVPVKTAHTMVVFTMAGGRGWVVVPDFFGDDVVLSASGEGLKRVGLPAENALVPLGDDSSSAVMCVWESAGQGSDLLVQAAQEDPPAGVCAITCTPGKRLWVACLDGPNLWQQLTVGEGKTPAAVLRTFKPPFPAKWRASFVGKDGVCESITFEQPPQDAPVPDEWRGPVIIYPIDRSRATPLTTILPMDVLRSTLGVGPCQYILDAEGLGGDDPAPPDAVVGWIERLVKKKRAARSAVEIKERLDAMLAHLKAARRRIDDYAAFGREVRHVCREAAKQDAEKEAAAAVLRICDRLDHDLARGRAQMKTPADAQRLAREIAALIEKPDALTGFAAPGKALRAIGHAFDATLARSRMAARRMKAYSRSQEGDLARTIETMAERRLRRKK